MRQRRSVESSNEVPEACNQQDCTCRNSDSGVGGCGGCVLLARNPAIYAEVEFLEFIIYHAFNDFNLY